MIKAQITSCPNSLIHTYKAEATFGLAEGWAASHNPNKEHHRTDSDDNGCWD